MPQVGSTLCELCRLDGRDKKLVSWSEKPAVAPKFTKFVVQRVIPDGLTHMPKFVREAIHALALFHEMNAAFSASLSLAAPQLKAPKLLLDCGFCRPFLLQPGRPPVHARECDGEFARCIDICDSREASIVKKTLHRTPLSLEPALFIRDRGIIFGKQLDFDPMLRLLLHIAGNHDGAVRRI